MRRAGEYASLHVICSSFSLQPPFATSSPPPPPPLPPKPVVGVAGVPTGRSRSATPTGQTEPTPTGAALLPPGEGGPSYSYRRELPPLRSSRGEKEREPFRLFGLGPSYLRGAPATAPVSGVLGPSIRAAAAAYVRAPRPRGCSGPCRRHLQSPTLISARNFLRLLLLSAP